MKVDNIDLFLFQKGVAVPEVCLPEPQGLDFRTDQDDSCFVSLFYEVIVEGLRVGADQFFRHSVPLLSLPCLLHFPRFYG